jgi:hypothetical protein
LESLAATLRTVELQITNARIAGYAIPVVVAINAWLLVTKFFAGEIPDFGALIGIALMTVFGAVIGAAIWHRRRTYLSPRRNELIEGMQAIGWNGSD